MAGNPLSDFMQRLGHQFADISILETALRHASLDVDEDNETLEFLGDRVLGLVIAEQLLDRHAGEEEGALSRRMNALVSGASCANIAEAMDLGAVMQADKGVKGGKSGKGSADISRNVLADGCEAVLGAVYRDGGLDAARQVILQHWRPLFEAQTDVPVDAKSALQEYLMKRGLALPYYKVIGRTGPDHAPQFTVRVTTDKGSAEAEGLSRRAAEQQAAAACLAQIEDAQ